MALKKARKAGSSSTITLKSSTSILSSDKITGSKHKSQPLMIQTLTTKGLLEDKVIDTRETAVKYMQMLKFR